MPEMTANDWQDEVVRLFGNKAAVDYCPGVPAWETRFRVYLSGSIIGSGNSYAEAVSRAKVRQGVL